MKTDDSVMIDLLLYWIVFLFAAIITPIITYLWKYQNVGFISGQFTGWVMTILFAACFLGTFISEGFRKNKKCHLPQRNCQQAWKKPLPQVRK